jgi:hypothetical protein
MVVEKTTQFTFGLMDKTVKGHMYSYFWTYDGSGHKTEIYLGRAGKPKTRKRALETKMKHLERLQQTIQEMLRQTRAELEQLPAEEARKT